jgi:ABC-2 type transport system permease protein
MRYLRLYLYFLRFSFSKAMSFRLDFFFRIFMDVIYYFVNISFFKLVYLHTPLLGGWNEPQMMIFVASYLVVDAINMTVFSTNMWWLPYYINRGELDYYLTRPVSPLFFLSFREFSANSFVNFFMAAAFFIYTLISYPASFSLADLALFGLLILNGVFLYYMIQMIMILPVFWTHSSRGFVDLFYALGLAMERPDRIFRGWLKIIFTTILPFALIASFPARLFLDGFRWDVLIHLSVVTVILWTVMHFVWRRGLRSYSSASS